MLWCILGTLFKSYVHTISAFDWSKDTKRDPLILFVPMIMIFYKLIWQMFIFEKIHTLMQYVVILNLGRLEDPC